MPAKRQTALLQSTAHQACALIPVQVKREPAPAQAPDPKAAVLPASAAAPAEDSASKADVREEDMVAALHKYGAMKVGELIERVKIKKLIQTDNRKKQQFLSIVRRISDQRDTNGIKLLYLKPGIKPTE